ncbi:FMN-binding protein [Negadavirga shengliensis]|uniref:Ion-translocating oxidoreductase complex subunit G n=1 Tax=Negadavirga shengliensis TaxID=1389218 RepID=A0ABV9SX53_9BACT
MNAHKTIAPGTTGIEGSGKMLKAMVGIGVLCALLIVMTYEGTRGRIETLKAEALEAAIFEVLPGTTRMTIYELGGEGIFTPSDGKDRSKTLVYAGFDEQGALTGIGVEASGQGYADIIRILYGYDPFTQTIIGFYVLESKETPGLGDKIEKDANFLANFDALDVSLSDDFSRMVNPVIPVKSGAKTKPWEVEGITGATISSRTIGNIIGESSARLIPTIYQQQDNFKPHHKPLPK